MILKKGSIPPNYIKKLFLELELFLFGVSLIVASLIFLPPDRYLLGILGGATIFLILGILDDKYDINPYIRLVGCILAAGITVFSGVKIFFITNPLGGDIIHFSQLLAIIFAILWISFLSNITNWSSGFDGQLPGIVVIAALTIAFLSFRFSADITQWPITHLGCYYGWSFFGYSYPTISFRKRLCPVMAEELWLVYARDSGYLSTTKIGTLLVVLGIPLSMPCIQ